MADLGRYNITSFKEASWLFTDLKPDRKRKSIKDESLESKKIIYSSLLTGAQYITDPEWREIITKAAYGVFPMGFSLRKDGISYNCSGKRVFRDPDSDPYNAVAQVMEFFRSVGGIKTTQDIQQENNNLAAYIKQGQLALQNQTWKDLTPKAKSRAIIRYVDNVAEEMNLNKKDRDWLCTVINIGILQGSIKDDDIEYSNGTIQNIKYIGYDEESKKFYCLPNSKKKSCNLPRGLYTDEKYFSPNHRSRWPPLATFGQFWKKFNQQPLKSSTTPSSFTSRHLDFSCRIEVTEIPSSSRDSIIDNYPVNNVYSNLPTDEDLFANPQQVLLNPRYELFTGVNKKKLNKDRDFETVRESLKNRENSFENKINEEVTRKEENRPTKKVLILNIK